MEFDELKKSENDYASLGLNENPFKISPLFRNFHDKSSCLPHESLLVIPDEFAKHMKILAGIKDRRILIYGCFGVGKTSLVDSLLYTGYHFRKRFCVRTIITEAYLDRSISELLLCICYEILDEIQRRTLLHPVQAIQKWIAEKRHGDSLLLSISKLLGTYTESKKTSTMTKSQKSFKAEPFQVGLECNLETQKEIREKIQSYISILPIKTMGYYLDDFLQIVRTLGFENIVVFIDEADHLPKIDAFIKLLVRAREILFADGYTFFVAGSPEIAKHTESIGSIFDKTLMIAPASFTTMKQILERRIRLVSPTKGLQDIFQLDALELLYDATKGVRKQFLRLAENALDLASFSGTGQVCAHHIWEAQQESKDKIGFSLKENEMKLLQALATLGASSPSRPEWQNLSGLSRATLSRLVKSLILQGMVVETRKGKQTIYTVSSAYLPYFQSNTL